MRTITSNRKKVIINELVIISLFFIVVMLGVIIECIAKNNNDSMMFKINDNLSMVMLQIQATLSTLTIAVMALLSGSISESYMGISISLYYLETRPCLTKTSYIIVAQFVLIITSIINHIYLNYYIVLSILISSILLIVITIFNIYEIFKGKDNYIHEIESYMDWKLNNDSDYKIIGRRYVENWEEVIVKQTQSEFDKFFDYFMIFIKRLFKENDIDDINSISEELVLCMLNSDYDKVKIKGIVFVDKYYKGMYLLLNDTGENIDSVKIHLFDEIIYEWIMTMKSLENEIFEDKIDFRQMIDYVIRLALLYNDKELDSYENRAILECSRKLGSLYQNYKKKGNILNDEKWERQISSYRDYYYSLIPEEYAEYYFELYALVDFNICYGYIMNGYMKLVENSIFNNDLASVYMFDSPAYVLRNMLIHCYMYYVGFRENTICVDEKIQDMVKEFLLTDVVLNAVLNFYYRLAENVKLLSVELERKLENIIYKNELFPKNGEAKRIITQDIAREYFLFVVLLVERFSYNRTFLSDCIDVDKYYIYLFDNKNNDLRKHFIEMRKLFFDDSKDERKNVDEMIFSFELFMKNKYKESLISQAVNIQKEYEESEKEKNIKVKIIDGIKERFEVAYRTFNKKLKKRKEYKKIRVFSCLDYTKGIDDENYSIYFEYSLGNFMGWLCNVLEDDFGIKTVNRKMDFKNDESFRTFLLEKNYDILIGSEYVFGCKDYDKYREHTEFLNSKQCEFIPNAKVGLACKNNNIYVKLENVTVEIHSPSIDEIETKRNENGTIRYSTIKGIALDFEENELKKYIFNERKIIDVFFDVKVGVVNSKKDVGTIVFR